jgi:hypothetical protein
VYEYDWTRTVTGATPQQCFDVVTDPTRATEWVSMANEVRAEGDPGVGRVLHIRAGIIGVSLTLEATVDQWDEPTSYAYGGDKPFHQHMAFTFTEAGDGTTMRCRVEFDPGRFFRFGTGKVAASTFAKQFQGDLDRLVALIERQ